MIGPRWHEVLSGRETGLRADLLRGMLSAAVPVYASAVAVRNAVYRWGWRRTTRLPVPVVSVGNLTTGGTGKTPVVAWVVEQLERLGATPAILSRGYGRRPGEGNDEKLVLDALCPGTLHLQNPDRATAGRLAIEEHRCDVLVLDDGFQHRQLARDLDLVLIDALEPWGYGHLLPRGLLREPRSSLRRADFVCLTRVDQCSDQQREVIHKEIRNWTDAPVAELAFAPRRLMNCAGETAPLETLIAGTVGAFCGIGNPQAFRRTLTGLAAPVSDQCFQTFPDHHHYTPAHLKQLAQWARSTGVERLVTTQKDLVKLPVERLGDVPLWGVEIGVEFVTGERELADRLRGRIASPGTG